MKSNREMTEDEFHYSTSVKKMLHRIEYLYVELESAKTIGMQGESAGALRGIEGRIFDLKAACYNALKTVGS